MSDSVQLTPTMVRSLAKAALGTCGLPVDSARCVADVITSAECCGCHSHGLFRLPGYCASLLGAGQGGAGPMQPHASTTRPVVEDAAPAVVRVDAGGGFSAVAIHAGLPMLVQKARDQGVAVCAIRNSMHFAALWYEMELLAARGLVGMAFVNSKSFVAHWGGTEKFYGTNPMAFGCPRYTPNGAGGLDALDPLVWDQASAKMARGEIQVHLREGKTLPPDCGVSPSGEATQDPALVLQGAQQTFGEHKGTAIALMVELLAGGLTGSPFAYETRDRFPTEPSVFGGVPSVHGELIIAIDPVKVAGSKAGAAAMYARIETLFERLLGQSGVRLPSQRRFKNRREMSSATIPTPAALHAQIIKIIESNGGRLEELLACDEEVEADMIPADGGGGLAETSLASCAAELRDFSDEQLEGELQRRRAADKINKNDEGRKRPKL